MCKIYSKKYFWYINTMFKFIINIFYILNKLRRTQGFVRNIRIKHISIVIVRINTMETCLL